jgi:hypothetical protein
MPLMRQYTEIIVEEGLLPQIVRELVEMAEDQNHIEVSYGVAGRVILVHPDLAEKWYQQKVSEAEDPQDVPIPVPVVRDPGQPRNIATSASDGEEPTDD